MLTADSRVQKSVSLTAFLVLFMLPSLSLGQPPGNDAATDRAALQAFTAEVHQLRITVEETVSLLPRMQLTISRLQMQQERVDRLTRELQDYRSQMEEAAENRENMANNLKELEAQADPGDPRQRVNMEAQRNFLKSQMEQFRIAEQRERAKEIELSTRLQKEEADLCDPNQQLNTMAQKLSEHH